MEIKRVNNNATCCGALRKHRKRGPHLEHRVDEDREPGVVELVVDLHRITASACALRGNSDAVGCREYLESAYVELQLLIEVGSQHVELRARGEGVSFASPARGQLGGAYMKIGQGQVHQLLGSVVDQRDTDAAARVGYYVSPQSVYRESCSAVRTQTGPCAARTG